MNKNLVTYENFVEAHKEILLEEKLLLEEISLLFEKEQILKDEMKMVNKKMPNIALFSGDAKQLSNMVNFTSTLASNVGSKVKQLDFVKNKVSDCLKLTNDILDLKYCAQNIEKALNNHDYEVAAVSIHKFFSIDESVILKSRNTPIRGKLLGETSLDEAFRSLHEAAEKLRVIVMKKFDDAVRDDDVAEVERFFKIFPMLNQRDEGVRKFSNYLCNKISDSLQANLSTENATYLDQLTWLFEAIAKTIDVHQPLFETYYGPGHLISAVEIFQRECDRRAKMIIEDFKNKKGLVSIYNLLQKTTKSGSSNSLNKLDPREIDSLLTEMTLLNSRSETFLKFLKERTTKDIDLLSPDNDKLRIDEYRVRLETLLRNCQLSLMVQELNGSYVLLEEFFLKESCLKAISLDDVDTPESLTSSVLDDVFFIVKKCITRAVSGGSLDVLCAIINHSVCILDTSLCETLNERIKYGYPQTGGISGAAAALDLSQAYNALQAGRYLQTNSDIEKAKQLFLISLNNLDVACECIKSLKAITSEQVNKSNHLTQSQVQKDKLESCLNDLLSLNNKFRTLINSGLNQLFIGLLKHRIKSWIDAFINEPHQLSESDILKYESNDGLRPSTQTFMIGLDSTFKSLKGSLTSNNYKNLVATFSTQLAERLENALLKCSFNKLGGYQFDREMRSIISYISSLTTVSIRDKFSRLKNIAIILNFDSVEEINDFFKSKSNQDQLVETLSYWWLTPNEVRQILKLRIDFSHIEILKIKI